MTTSSQTPIADIASRDIASRDGKVWGIVRYAPGTGLFPDEDVASFDGWYSDRALAATVSEDWKRQFPYWTVALVASEDIHFGVLFHRPKPVRQPITQDQPTGVLATSAREG
jgi:hypothetical protein